MTSLGSKLRYSSLRQNQRDVSPCVEFFCSAYYFNIINVTLICSKKILTVALLFVQLFYKIRSSISGPILVDGCALTSEARFSCYIIIPIS